MPMTLDKQALIEKLCALAGEQVGVDGSDLTESTHLFNDLGYDSLDQMEFAMTVEEEYDVDIPDEAANDVKTVRDAYEALMKELAKR